MAGFHIDRISEDIKREIVSIMRELKDPRISDMLTVVKVDVSGDLSYAKVYISAMDGIDAAKRSVKCAGIYQKATRFKASFKKKSGA